MATALGLVQAIHRGAGRVVSLNAVAAAKAGAVPTARGAVFAVPQRALREPLQITWDYTPAGAASVQVDLIGCIADPTVDANWFVLDSGTSTATEKRHVVNKNVLFLALNVTTLDAGTVSGGIFIG